MEFGKPSHKVVAQAAMQFVLENGGNCDYFSGGKDPDLEDEEFLDLIFAVDMDGGFLVLSFGLLGVMTRSAVFGLSIGRQVQHDQQVATNASNM
ncbi:UNVERIFIED_CONTAM: hypothetical protein FKN15_072104 [Acipenser sinensis]